MCHSWWVFLLLAFYVNLHRAVIGPSATLTGRWRPDIDLCRMLTGSSLCLCVYFLSCFLPYSFHLRKIHRDYFYQFQGIWCYTEQHVCYAELWRIFRWAFPQPTCPLGQAEGFHCSSTSVTWACFWKHAARDYNFMGHGVFFRNLGHGIFHASSSSLVPLWLYITKYSRGK